MALTPDFLNLDFNRLDFYTNDNAIVNSQPDFSKLLYNKLPYYFIEQDTYKDSNGNGLLNRYLNLFGGYIKDEILPSIENYLDIIQSTITDEKYVTTISATLGNPPDIFKTVNEYRNLLSHIVSIYKIKGTIKGYQVFFGILGYDVTIYEVPLLTSQVIDQYGDRYDDNINAIYDTGDINFTYDQSIVEYCSEYDLTLTAIHTGSTPTQDLIDRIKIAILFNEPVNAKLRNLVIN